MIRALILLLLFTATGFSTGQQSNVLKVNSRIVLVEGEIRDLKEQSKKLMELAVQDSAPIYVFIDSYGGSVIAGGMFIQAIDRVKSYGVEVRCVVEGVAASMAMHIFANCSKRYAFETSLLLWHPAYRYVRGAAITEKVAERISKQIKLLTELYEMRLKKALALKDEVYYEYYYNEYFVTAWRLNKLTPSFMQIIDNAVGE